MFFLVSQKSKFKQLPFFFRILLCCTYQIWRSSSGESCQRIFYNFLKLHDFVCNMWGILFCWNNTNSNAPCRCNSESDGLVASPSIHRRWLNHKKEIYRIANPEAYPDDFSTGIPLALRHSAFFWCCNKLTTEFFHLRWHSIHSRVITGALKCFNP